jgi:hypothetical protein
LKDEFLQHNKGFETFLSSKVILKSINKKLAIFIVRKRVKESERKKENNGFLLFSHCVFYVVKIFLNFKEFITTINLIWGKFEWVVGESTLKKFKK